METKKQLELKLKDLRESKDRLYDDNLRIVRDVEDLNKSIKKLESTKEGLLKECNDRANYIKHILNILLGEANPMSKYEVIRDMFSKQIKDLKSLEKEENARGRPFHIRFLSEEIRNQDFQGY